MILECLEFAFICYMFSGDSVFFFALSINLFVCFVYGIILEPLDSFE